MKKLNGAVDAPLGRVRVPAAPAVMVLTLVRTMFSGGRSTAKHQGQACYGQQSSFVRIGPSARWACQGPASLQVHRRWSIAYASASMNGPGSTPPEQVAVQPAPLRLQDGIAPVGVGEAERGHDRAHAADQPLAHVRDRQAPVHKA